jgi:hypothetical protein
MKKILTRVLPVLALSAITAAISVAQFPEEAASDTGKLETMIVASGTVAMDLDLNRLNGTAAKAETLRFQAVNDSFFPLIVFNDELRGPQLGSIALIPTNSAPLPDVLNGSINSLIVEKTRAGEVFDLVVRDGQTGFLFFNVEGNTYDYDAASQSVAINGGRLLISEEFAKALGRPSDAGTVMGTMSVAAKVRPIEVRQVVNGEDKSAVLPAGAGLTGDAPALVPGPDVIVGDMPSMQQFGSSGTRVGLAIGTTSCNAGTVELNWFAMPNTDHPVIPQNLYRMSGGANNTERFVQIGHSWLKHAFTALQGTVCGSCTPSSSGGSKLGVGCSDPYSAGLNAGQSSLGSRAWVNPFTGAYPQTARNHTGHTESGSSHRLLVEASDLLPASNVGATYFGEAQYVTPHEYAWCQTHPGECNMYNNTSIAGSPSAAQGRASPSGTQRQPCAPNLQSKPGLALPLTPSSLRQGWMAAGSSPTK